MEKNQLFLSGSVIYSNQSIVSVHIKAFLV